MLTAAQGEHFDRPLGLQLVPVTQGTLQVASAVRVQSSRTPLGQLEAGVQVLHGAKPLALKVLPFSHEIMVLHLVSKVAVHDEDTPSAQEDVAVQTVHGE